MRTLSVLLLLILTAACNSNPTSKKEETASAIPEKTISISDADVQDISALLDSYEALRDAFVEYDSASVNIKATDLAAHLDSFTVTGITDTVLADTLKSAVSKMSASAASIPVKATLEEKKRSFSELSSAFYTVLTKVQYDRSVVYKQTCPMAFNDNEAASWISRSSEINNPYLGKKHPKYSSGMLHCGEVSDSVAYKK